MIASFGATKTKLKRKTSAICLGRPNPEPMIAASAAK
jgi:hypothetical protein